MFRCRTALAVSLVAVLVAGCGAKGTSHQAATTSTTTDAPTDADRAADAKNKITVIDAGARPRRRLALHLAVGAQPREMVRTSIQLRITLDGQSQPAVATPINVLSIDSAIDSIDPDGTVHFSMSFVDVTLEANGASPATMAATRPIVEQLKGLKGTGTTDIHGGSLTSTFDTSRITNPALRSSLDQTSSQIANLGAALPSEPLGPGAKWQVARSATINGVQTNSTVTFSMTSLVNDHYALNVAVDSTAPAGPVNIPTLPKGTTANIVSLVLKGTGQISGDLTSLLPESSSQSTEGDMSFTVADATGSGSLLEHLISDMSMKRA